MSVMFGFLLQNIINKTKKNTTMLYIDTREIKLIELLQIQKGNIRQLDVGDIWIGEGEMGLVIERKSIRDLESSILDGRYKEQLGRILSYCQTHKAQPMYILEGPLNSSTGRLQTKAIMKIINRLIFHYQIPVMQTSCVRETAELVRALIEHWTENPKNLQRATELIKVTDGIHVRKKANASDFKYFGICCLAQCPGVSVKMGEVLITTFGSLKGVMDANVKEIEDLKVGARKIGPVVSKRLKEILNKSC